MKNNPRKQQILKAAQKRFVRHGLNKTTVEEIARDLRVGKATIYHYFESKEEIFYVVLQMEIDRFSEELKLILSDAGASYNVKMVRISELKEKTPEKFGLIYELINIMIHQEPLEKESLLFNNLVSAERNILTDYFKTEFGKKQIDQTIVEFFIRQSWSSIISNRLFKNSGEQVKADTELLSNFLASRLT